LQHNFSILSVLCQIFFQVESFCRSFTRGCKNVNFLYYHIFPQLPGRKLCRTDILRVTLTWKNEYSWWLCRHQSTVEIWNQPFGIAMALMEFRILWPKNERLRPQKNHLWKFGISN
jgi:hypothetical protein